MSNQSKALTFHVANEPSESCFHARVEFLNCVALHRPQVLSDLWEKAFPEFKFAIVRHFRKEIREGVEDIQEYFTAQQKKYLEDPNSHYVHLLHRRLEAATGAPPYSSFELLTEHPELKEKIHNVMGEFLVAFQNGLIAKLIQSKLNTEFGLDPIRSKFRCYGDIAGRDVDKKLADIIQTWSETWHLDADWCRDHAVTVLREWMSNNQLSSVGLYTTEQAMQRTGWASATRELLYASITSRISAESAVYGIHGPKPLRFNWNKNTFEKKGFNRLKESQNAYKQKSLLEFELWLSDKRRPLLLDALHSEPMAKIESYYEVLKRFRSLLDKHVRGIIKSTNKSVRRLGKTKTKRSLSDHSRWAVEFHVPPAKTLDEIVKFEEDAVAVADLLSASRGGMTLEEIDREYAAYQYDPTDINGALGLLFARGLVSTQQEDPTSRVIDALRAEGRDDLFAPYSTVADEQKASAEIRKRIDADHEKTGGAVIVRYVCSAAKKIPKKARDRSVINRAARDILKLIGLENSVGIKRIPARNTTVQKLARGA